MLSHGASSGLKLVVMVLLAGCSAAAGGDAAAVHVDRIAGIYAGKSPTPRERAAVSQLKLGMKQLYGVTLKDLPGPAAAGQDRAVIVVGRRAATAGKWVTDTELARVKPGGYVIKCGDGRIVIAGEDGWCTYYGVLELLERQGLRFFTRNPNQAWAPKPTSRLIPPCAVFDRPVFAIRNGWSALQRQFHATLGDPRKGLNPELFTRQAGSDLWVDHTAGYLVPKAIYYDKHPEYYAMDRAGKRIAKDAFTDHRTCLCLSNPDVTKISIERALAWIKLNPEKRFFQITYGDTGTWCQCPECRKHDPAPGQYATRLLKCWVNPVAKAIAAKYPGKILLTFAYAGSDKAPAKVRPAKNVWVVVATGCGFFPFWEHAYAQKSNKLMRPQLDKVEGWTAVAPGQVSVCEYLGAYEPAIIDKMTGRLRYYAKIGLRGVNATYGAPSNFRPVWSYVWPKMGWDPSRDGLAMAKEFIRHHYGPAAGPVARFFDLTHQRYQATLASRKKLTDASYPPDYYAPEFTRQALACFTEAVAAAADKPKLKKALQNEQYLFLGDLVGHLPAYDLSDASNRRLLGYLDRRRALARQIGREVPFIRETQHIAIQLEKKRAGYRDLIGRWLGESAELKPVAIPNGLRFRPEMFLWGHYGPDNFPKPTCQSHAKFPCPPKFCVGVLPKGTNSRGKPNSTRMQVSFKLKAAPGDGSGSLTLEGQDAIRYWARPKEFAAVGHIAVVVNDKTIFSGEGRFVRGNWSRRTFKLPPGTLRAGRNVIEIRNTTPGRPGISPFTVCWFMLSDATLTFGSAGAS